eukprot:PhF_6_TR37669/c0_g1_i1/m.56058
MIHKWYVLTLFCILAFNQYSIYFTFACIDPDIVAARLPGYDAEWVRWTLLSNPVGYFVCVPWITMLAVSPMGLRKCCRLAAVLQFLSSGGLSAIFFFGLPTLIDSLMLRCLVLCTFFVNAVTMPVVTALCPQVSVEWFPVSQQGLALSLSNIASTSAIVLWFCLGPVLVASPDHLNMFVYIRFISTVPPCLFLGLWYPAQSQREGVSFLDLRPHSLQYTPYATSLCERLRVQSSLLFLKPQRNFRSFFIVILLGGFQLGIGVGVGLLFQDILQHRFTPTEIGWVGFFMTASVIPTSILAGMMCDFVCIRSKLHMTYFLSNVTQWIAAASFAFCLYSDTITFPWMAACAGVYGGTWGVCSVCSIIRGLDVAPDLPEPVIGFWNSLFLNVGNVFVFVIPGSLMKSVGIFANVVFVSCLLCFITLWGSKEKIPLSSLASGRYH